MILSILLLVGPALAEVDEKCINPANGQYLVDMSQYDEQAQRDFLNNYVALGTTLSAIHGPIPHAPGRGAIGVDLAVIPPLGCQRRFVEEGTKTEDTNKVPVVPRPRITFSLPQVGSMIPYASIAYVPPVPVGGTYNVIVSGEFGVGVPLGSALATGVRFHATSHRTVGDTATKYEPDDGDYLDLYLASTFGVDLMAGLKMGRISPYASVGFVDVSTFFWIGDDGVVPVNEHPYAGPVFSAGLDGLFSDQWRLAGEFYAAPGGQWGVSDPEAVATARYGRMYTLRFRVARELGRSGNEGGVSDPIQARVLYTEAGQLSLRGAELVTTVELTRSGGPATRLESMDYEILVGEQVVCDVSQSYGVALKKDAPERVELPCTIGIEVGGAALRALMTGNVMITVQGEAHLTVLGIEHTTSFSETHRLRDR